MNLVQRKFYLPQDVYTDLSLTAKTQGKNITELLREFVVKGLEEIKSLPKQNSKNLLDIVKQADREKWGGPENLAANHDEFFAQLSDTSKVKKND